MTFKQLAIGRTFDFVDSDATNRSHGRFTKVSDRCYTWQPRNGDKVKSQVKTINAQVYHVGAK